MKVTITIQDSRPAGRIKMNATFSKPITDKTRSAAAMLAMDLMKAAGEMCRKQDEE